MNGVSWREVPPVPTHLELPRAGVPVRAQEGRRHFTSLTPEVFQLDPHLLPPDINGTSQHSNQNGESVSGFIGSIQSLALVGSLVQWKSHVEFFQRKRKTENVFWKIYRLWHTKTHMYIHTYTSQLRLFKHNKYKVYHCEIRFQGWNTKYWVDKI